MAKTDPEDAGAPIPRDAIDPALVKLGRTRAKIGVITALGIVVLCGYFLVKLGPDRDFAGEPEAPTAVALADVVADRVSTEDHIEVEAEPVLAHAIRMFKDRGELGLRLVPVRGTNDRVWIALPGDGWADPTVTRRYRGRLRRLADLSFATAVYAQATEQPRPVFARSADLRAAFATGKLRAVTGEDVAVADGDRVAYDLVEPARAVVVASIVERFPTSEAWVAALSRAGLGTITAAPPKDTDEAFGVLRFDIARSPAETTKQLAATELFATRVEPVIRHVELTWGALARSGGGADDPLARADLVGVYAKRGIPDDAYVVIAGEVPQDYWYVRPISFVLLGIGLLFAWALVRAVRRDLLPTRA